MSLDWVEEGVGVWEIWGIWEQLQQLMLQQNKRAVMNL